MLESNLPEARLTATELLAFLEAINKTYANAKSRPEDSLRRRVARGVFVLIATRRLRQLIRRARRLAKGSPSSERLNRLMEDVFVERRVLRSPVVLWPDYPAVAQAAARLGRDIAARGGDAEKLSVGAVLQLCGSETAQLVATFDRPEVCRALSAKHADLLGVEGLYARDLVGQRACAAGVHGEGRIAYVAAMTQPYRTNGYSTRTEGVALAYTANGFQVEVISKPGFPLNIMSKKAQADIPEVETCNGVTYHRILSPMMTSRKYSAYARKAAEALEQKLRQLEPAHVIAASDYRNSLPVLVAARRLGLPFAYEVRGMWELTWASDNPGYENTRQFAVAQEMEAFVCRQADRVLTLTEGMKESLVARGVDRDKIALMPNGVSADMLETRPHDDALASKLGIGQDTVVIGYAGAFKEYEGLPDLAAASAALVGQGLDVVLLIVGAEKPDAFGSTPITDEIRAAFQTCGRPERLIMTGRVPFADMTRYYALMDICPITRRGYAVSELVSPIKPVEAMAQRKAVVLSDVAALKYFSQNGTTALVFRKGDADDLAEKLAQLVEDKEARAALGMRARTFVESELMWPQICARAAEHIGLESVATRR